MSKHKLIKFGLAAQGDAVSCVFEIACQAGDIPASCPKSTKGAKPAQRVVEIKTSDNAALYDIAAILDRSVAPQLDDADAREYWVWFANFWPEGSEEDEEEGSEEDEEDEDEGSEGSEDEDEGAPEPEPVPSKPAKEPKAKVVTPKAEKPAKVVTPKAEKVDRTNRVVSGQKGFVADKVIRARKNHREHGLCEYDVRCLASGGFEVVRFVGARTDIKVGDVWPNATAMFRRLTGRQKPNNIIGRWFNLTMTDYHESRYGASSLKSGPKRAAMSERAKALAGLKLGSPKKEGTLKGIAAGLKIEWNEDHQVVISAIVEAEVKSGALTW